MSEADVYPPNVNDTRFRFIRVGCDDYTSMNAEMQKEFSHPSFVDIGDFLPIMLEGETNYHKWEKHMRRLLQSNILDLIETNYHRRSDTVMKEWIFRSLSEDVKATVVGLDTANEVWDSLKATYYITPSASVDGPPSFTARSITEMSEADENPPLSIGALSRQVSRVNSIGEIAEAYWKPPSQSDIRRRLGSDDYTSINGDIFSYPSFEDIAEFLPIKLKDVTNYNKWEIQMKQLLQNYDMLDLIDGTLEEEVRGDPERYSVAKEWIFGSLSEDVKVTVVHLNTANKVWNALKNAYDIGSTKIKDTTRYLPLFRAILRSEWEEAHKIIRVDKDALAVELNPEGYSALHIAVDQFQNSKFLESLLKEIEDLTLVTHEELNALHVAAMIGKTEAAEMLVKKNPILLFMVDKKLRLPMVGALVNGHIDTFKYLLEACKINFKIGKDINYGNPFKGEPGVVLLSSVIEAGLVDVACELLSKYPDMGRTKYATPLTSIATKGDLYYSATQYNFYQTFIYNHVPTEINNLDGTNIPQDIESQDNCNSKRQSCFNYVIQKIYGKFWKVALQHVAHVKHLQKEKVKHNNAIFLLKLMCEKIGKLNQRIDISELYREAFHLAVVNDTPEVVDVIIQFFPQAVWTTNDNQYVTQIAIKDRCLKVHNVLLHHLTRNKYLSLMIFDEDGNTFSHLAAQLAPLPILNLIPGAALQMQRELQWFKGVEKFDRPQSQIQRNAKKETPMMVFRSKHVNLRKEGEEWMKKTADSYTITAALIVTIVFAAAITVPGGNADSGAANYATKASFFIFIISDAISLFTSTTSLLLFLSILTMRYREEDFLYRLPKRLILGLTMLFLSVTTMMIAFGATLYLTFGQERTWILYPVAALTCLPIASFVTLQLPLLVELISSTYFYADFSKDIYHSLYAETTPIPA